VSRHVEVRVAVVLLTIHGGALKALLVPQRDGSYALPSGTLGFDEPLSAAAERVMQSAGAHADYLEQLYTFGNLPPSSSERFIEVSYFALVPSAGPAGMPADGRPVPGGPAWFAEGEQPSLILDHANIVKAARIRLRGKLSYTAVGFELLPEVFTLAELQNIYELILGKQLDKRNFRRKIYELGIVEPTGEERASFRGRPASLYRFKAEVFEQIEAKRDILAF
jgi:hypothetical protein